MSYGNEAIVSFGYQLVVKDNGHNSFTADMTLTYIHIQVLDLIQIGGRNVIMQKS